MKLFKDGELKHLGLFYLHSMIESSLALTWIYWIVFLLDQGFSYAVIGLALGINGLAMVLLEIPTGAVADVVSRKLSVILGFIGFGSVLLIIPSIGDPLLLVAVFTLWALPVTLISGAADAWVVDNLKAESREDLVDEYFTKVTSIGSFGFIVAAVVSGLVVANLGMVWIFYIQGVAMIGSTAILAAQREHFKRARMTARESVMESYRNVRYGARFSLENKRVLYLMAALFFVGLGGEFIMVLRQPFMEAAGIPRELLGYVIAAGAALAVGAPFLAKRVGKRFKVKNEYLALHTLFFACVLVSLLFFNAVWAVVLIVAILGMRWASFGPVFEPFFQGHLPSKIRATMGSFKNMVFAVGLLAGDIVISALTDDAGPGSMLVLGGILTLPAIILFFMVDRRPAGVH